MDAERVVTRSELAEGVLSTLRRLRNALKEKYPERFAGVEHELLCGELIQHDGLKDRLKEAGFNVEICSWRLAQPNEVRIIVRCIRRSEPQFELYGQVLVQNDATNTSD